MYKEEAIEAAPICERVLGYLLTLAPTRGRPGADLRTAVGKFLAHAEELIQHDESGPPLDQIFDLARITGISRAHVGWVRRTAAKESPVTIGAAIIKNALIHFALATEARIIANMSFTSRQDVEVLRTDMNNAFEPMEEIAADDMAQMTYQALIGLHAAVSFYLIETARPLPRMIGFRFFESLPSLVLAYRLYSDASRADELRVENKIVHPAFMKLTGRALSN
jgi:prophage DNA circulation protein